PRSLSPLLILLPSALHRYLHSFPTRRSSDLLVFIGVHLLKKRLAVIEFLIPVLVHLRIIFPVVIVHVFDLFHARLKSFLHFLKRSEEHTSELQSRFDLVCRLLLEKKTPSHVT